MKLACTLLACLVLASCSSNDGESADAAAIILDEDGGEVVPGPADADVIDPPGPADASIPTGAACDEGSCDSCQMCSMTGPEGNCGDELAACQGNQDCIDFAGCIDPCADQACIDNCVAMHDTGFNIYLELLGCVICGDCFNTCDGAAAGCS